MALNYLKDPAAQTPNFPASNNEQGVESVVKFYENGTEEVKNLLRNECAVIYECSYCRSLFRSIINFVAHKRTICRSLQSSVRSEQLELIRDQQVKQQADKDTDSATATRRTAKNNRNLRRFNPVSSLAKHVRPINLRLERAKADIELPTLPRAMRSTAHTSIIDGKQVVDQLPMELSLKDRVPDNRAVLVMPRENSVRCGEMQLRRRRGTQMVAMARKTDATNVRELSGEEIELIERIPSAIPVDFTTLRCEDKRCLIKQPFSSLSTLAHHLAIQHQLEYADESLVKNCAETPFIKCFLCDTAPFKGLKELQKHFNAAHAIIRQQHNRFRVDQANADSNTKRRDLSPSGFRSLSPVSLPAVDPYETADETATADEDEEGEAGGGGTVAPKGAAKRKSYFRRPIVFEPINKAEDKQQHIEAAVTLKEWIQRGGIRGKKNSGKGGSNDGPKKGNPDDGMPMLQMNVMASDEGGRIRLIDEEEARKIDQLLNSKTNAMAKLTQKDTTPEEEDEENGKAEGGGFGGGNGNTREKRPRKPNRKFMTETGESEQQNRRRTTGDKRVKPSDTQMVVAADHIASRNTQSRSTSAVHSNEGTPKPPKTKPSASGGSQKRKHNSRSFGKPRSKKPKLINGGGGSSSFKRIGEEKRANGQQIPPVEDFVLPPSIMGEENGTSDQPEPPKLIREERTQSPEPAGTLSPPESQAELEEDSSRDGHETPTAKGQKQQNIASPLTKDQLPTMITGRYREEMVFYTPNAKKVREEDLRKHQQQASSSSSTAGSSRRKQNLNAMDLSEEFSVLGTEKKKGTGGKPLEVKETAREPAPPKPKDLTQVPVYLTELQRDLFFKPLKPLFNTAAMSDGLWQCGECGEVLKCIKDGRRHMVSHIRVMRIRCSLCDAGAFFCSDMRVHLMYRHCTMLHIAPDDYVSPGVPCMDKEKADILTCLVDPYHPGRVMYTTGKIVSWSNPKAYLPDPKIERNILGPALPGYLSSSGTSPRKQFKSSILARKSNVSTAQQQQKEKEKQNEETTEKEKDGGGGTSPVDAEETTNGEKDEEKKEDGGGMRGGEEKEVNGGQKGGGEEMEEGGRGSRMEDHDYGGAAATPAEADDVQQQKQQQQEDEGVQQQQQSGKNPPEEEEESVGEPVGQVDLGPLVVVDDIPLPPPQ